MSDDMKFKECPECSARSGTPELCDSCAHNRKVIGKLREDREEWECERAQLREHVLYVEGLARAGREIAHALVDIATGGKQ